MEMYNNMLCISSQELTGIVSLSALKKMNQRGTVQQVRRACYGTSALYVWKACPYNTAPKFTAAFPTCKNEQKASHLLIV